MGNECVVIVYLNNPLLGGVKKNRAEALVNMFEKKGKKAIVMEIPFFSLKNDNNIFDAMMMCRMLEVKGNNDLSINCLIALDIISAGVKYRKKILWLQDEEESFLYLLQYASKQVKSRAQQYISKMLRECDKVFLEKKEMKDYYELDCKPLIVSDPLKCEENAEDLFAKIINTIYEG